MPFQDLRDAERKIGAWWRDYNDARPHSALGGQTLVAFAAATGVTAFAASILTTARAKAKS
jgi:transposase InsO family protein